MRFISPIGNYRIVAIHDEVAFNSDGVTRTTKPGYTVEFKQGVLSNEEKDLARQHLQFPGGVVDRRNVDGSPYDYIPLASVFDTEWIEDEETRKKVEKRLLSIDGFDRPDNFILVREQLAPAPWPNYDELTVHGARTAEKVAKQNIEVARATGMSMDVLIAYERQNRNDERILAAYEAEKEPKEAEELVQA